MLLNFSELVSKYNIKSKGVIAVGAHFGEEHNDYLAAGIPRMVYIEPCAKAFEELKRRFRYAPNVRLYNLACGDKSAVNVTMYTGDNSINKGQSNSLLKPALHLNIHPEVDFPDTEEVAVDLLDNLDLIGRGYDFLNMDCQGYETFVIRGATKLLPQINWIYSEVNFGEVYTNCGRVEELDELLSDFSRVENGPKVGGLWSDALYVRKTLL